MSLILDALNKAQRERQEQQEPVPQLTTVHYTPPPPAAKSRHWLRNNLVVGVGLTCLTAFAGGFWFASGETGTPAASPPVPQRATQSANAAGSPERELSQSISPTPAISEGASSPTAATPAARPAKEEVAGLYQAARSDTGSSRIRSRPTADINQPSPAVRRSDAVSASLVRPAGTEPQPPQADGAAVNEPAAPVAPVEPANTLASRRELPYLQELSWSLQQRLPSIMYSEHHYEPGASGSRVVINGATHGAGARLGEGLVLEEILSDGVVLRYQAQRFKLPALNSWVNF